MVLISIAVQPKPRRKGDRPGPTVQAAEAFRADSTSRLTSYLPEHGFATPEPLGPDYPSPLISFA